MRSNTIATVVLALCVLSGNVIANASAPAAIQKVIAGSHDDYTFMWWGYGWRGDKIRCLQTSSYGMVMDVSNMRVTHFGKIEDPLPYEQAVSLPNDVVINLPEARLEISVESGDTKYTCVSGKHPRLIDSGRFLQRSDIQGLVLKSANGKLLPADCRLEITAWPDQLSLILEIEPNQDMDSAVASVRFRAKVGAAQTSSSASHWKKGVTQTVSMVLFQQSPDERDPSLSDRVQAYRYGESRKLPVNYDVTRGCYRVELPRNAPSKPDTPNLQRIRLHLNNPHPGPRVFRLNFAREGGVSGITGLVPMLRDTRGNPTGIPVQISKNWHTKKGQTSLYQGPWLHALTMLRVPGGFEGDLEFCISRNFWGKLPVASHAQLCLIGWGTDQLWDEAAIGSWGESICYDPDVCLNRSVIDDMRPLMVTKMRTVNGKWGWSNNVGGGDFLVYFNENNQKQFLSRMRTAYLSQGPNLTDVVYSGISADGKIAASLRVMTPRCDDINRAYHSFRYDVLKPTSFRRLAFYQVGADRYNDHQFARLARGNETGLAEEWDAPQGGRRYHRAGVACPGKIPWFSLHRAVSKDKQGGAWANRGLVVRSWKARLGGKDCPPFAAVYGTVNRHPSCNIELSPPPGLSELKPGDFVEAKIELLVLPQFAKDYYGPNEKLRQTLNSEEDTWKPVLRQAAENALTVTTSKGTLLQAFPVRIAIDQSQVAEFTVEGGVGYSPITFTGLRDYRGGELSRWEGNEWSVIDQSVFGNDFWQIDKTADNRFAITFNVLLDAADGRQRFRFVSSQERDTKAEKGSAE